jgi:thiol-disulfide isomerase/thioredoxin
MLKKTFTLAVILFSFHVFAQDLEPEFTVKGSIRNKISEIIVSNAFEVDPNTGKYKDQPIDEVAIKATRTVTLDSERAFEMDGISFKFGESLMIVDSKSEYGQMIIIDTEKAVNRKIDLGQITLEKLNKVRGKLAYSTHLMNDQNKKTNIIVSYKSANGGLHPVAFSAVDDDSQFRFRLPNGGYTMFVDVDDSEKDFTRTVRSFEIKDKGYSFVGPVLVKTKLDDFVNQKTPLRSILKSFTLTPEVVSQRPLKAINLIQENPPQVTILYFFAGYCGPCFSDNGLRKYMEMAAAHRDQMAVLAVHSDSYAFGSCPQSESQMIEWSKSDEKEKVRWQTLYRAYDTTEFLNPKVAVFWQSPDLAKQVYDVTGYPTTLIFENGFLIKRFVGFDADIAGYLQKMLDKK